AARHRGTGCPQGWRDPPPLPSPRRQRARQRDVQYPAPRMADGAKEPGVATFIANAERVTKGKGERGEGFVSTLPFPFSPLPSPPCNYLCRRHHLARVPLRVFRRVRQQSQHVAWQGGTTDTARFKQLVLRRVPHHLDRRID